MKNFKHMTAVSRNIYFDTLDCIVDHSSIGYNVHFNKKDSRFKVGDYVRISKYKNIFAKRYAPNWSEEAFVISTIKNRVP